jgi:hypothetical protein
MDDYPYSHVGPNG